MQYILRHTASNQLALLAFAGQEAGGHCFLKVECGK
jgi:hypothetical protein